MKKLLQHKSVIIYITGKPGMGKYTIAKELAKDYGYIVCDNQLINNPVFELLQYDGFAKIPDFAWDAIGKIRSEIFEFLAKIPTGNYVLTNNLFEDVGDKSLYEQVKNVAQLRGSIFIPVKLMIDPGEHVKRITSPARRLRWKSIDPQDVYDQTPILAFEHPNLLKLDVTNLSAEQAASMIIKHAEKCE